MFSNVFLKTLYEKRWATLWWSVSGMLLTVFILSLFPTFKEALGQSLDNVPESLRSLIGDSAAYATLDGYMQLQVFDQMVFLPVILGIIMGTGVLAGDENEGTLQTLLALPVRRSQVFIQKLLACAVVIAVVTGSLLAGAVIGQAVVGEWLPMGHVLLTTVHAWLVAMVFCLLGYAVGAITGKRGLAGAIGGMLAFVTYMVTTLSEGVKGLRVLDHLSPWHYYNRPSALDGVFPWTDMLVLAAISIVLAIVSFYVFIRRDIYQR